MQNLYSNISDNMTTWQKELCDMMVSYKINFSDARKYGLVFLDKTILITGDIFENLKEYYSDDTNRTNSIIIYGILIAVVNLYLIFNDFIRLCCFDHVMDSGFFFLYYNRVFDRRVKISLIRQVKIHLLAGDQCH